MLECGVLVYPTFENSNEDSYYFITCNGSYLLMWVKHDDDNYENVECKSFELGNAGNSLMDLPLRKIVSLAAKWAVQKENEDLMLYEFQSTLPRIEI